MPETNDLFLNPEKQGELLAEKCTVEKIGGVHYFSNPSEQIPTKKNIKIFTKIMDDKANYPVLIHCYHGTGRAELYSAIYRIEYENFTNEDARKGVRTLIKWSSFDDGKPQRRIFKSIYKSKTIRLVKEIILIHIHFNSFAH